jgi:hypothetical protein
VLLGNRSDVQCRYRYRQLQKERGFEEERGRRLERAPVIGWQPEQFVMDQAAEEGSRSAEEEDEGQTEGGEKFEQTGCTGHPISSPSFDGRLYSVY